MRLRGRRDANHREIVEALRARGLSVLDLGGVGCGCPDLLVGARGVNLLLEIKDGSLPPWRRKLTPAEQAFAWHWRGCVETVDTVRAALLACEVHGLLPVAIA